MLSDDGCCGFHAAILRNLDKIATLVGDVRFQSFLDVPDLRDRYYKLSKNSNPQSSINAAAAFSAPPVSKDLVYGIIPGRIIAQLDDRTDVYAQLRAARELKEIVMSTPYIHCLRPQLTDFLVHVASLLQEKSNFEVCFLSLIIPPCRFARCSLRALSLAQRHLFNQSVNQSINFRVACRLINKQLPQGPRKEKKLI